MELNGKALDMNPAIIRSVEAIFPTLYERETSWTIAGSAVAADRRTASISSGVTVAVGRLVLTFPAQGLDMGIVGNWDSISPDYTVAANRAGRDFYIYALATGQLLLSANSTVPAGYTMANSRNIAGCHCLCADAGIIAGHSLSGFVAGDILPLSLWDQKFRPSCSPEGMVYLASFDKFIDIYLTSGTGVSSRSAYGATITDTRDWMDFTDDHADVGKQMLSDAMFQSAAALSNEKTNILGSADPVTAGGHMDTSNRRMVSGIGCEDMCGALWQWLSDQSYKNDGTYDGVFGYYALPGGKGMLNRQGAAGDVKLLAGGCWYHGTSCGSRGRGASNARWTASSNIGSRGCAVRQG